MFKGYARAAILVALLSVVIAAAGFAVTTGQFDSSNSVADETSDNDVDVFPLAGVTTENLAVLYRDYDIFTVDSATDLNKLSNVISTPGANFNETF